LPSNITLSVNSTFPLFDMQVRRIDKCICYVHLLGYEFGRKHPQARHQALGTLCR